MRRDFEDLMILHECVPAYRFTLAGHPDDMSVLAADNPAPVRLGPSDAAIRACELHVIKGHQVVQFDLPPGTDMPEATPALDHAVGHGGKVAAEGLAKGLPPADPPTQRLVELWHAGCESLKNHAGG